MTTGFLYDSRFLDHLTGPGHPESPARLTAVMKHLETLEWFARLERVAAKPSDWKWIETVHAPAYVRRAEDACVQGARMLDTPDVSISESSFDAAVLAAGGALALADAMMEGKIQNGFALLRPPGHHAENTGAMGFCLFNNVAILARYLQRRHGLEKILILDWDVHHGNGTQHTFESDPTVFYISAHQYPYYPGTGSVHETGKGKGEGYTLNCPMRAGWGDKAYEAAFTEKILPAIETYKPDAILISAGFDAHADDPLGSIQLSTEFFGWMTERMKEMADKHARGRLISLLEGGYNLNALPLCVAAHLQSLRGAPQARRGNLPKSTL